MAMLLRQSTTVTVQMGPALDKTDGVTEETALSPTVNLSKNGAAFAARNSVTAITHDTLGYYRVEFNATDTNTLGRLRAMFHAAATHLPVWHDFLVITQNAYDALVAGTATLAADTTLIEGVDATNQIRDAILSDATRFPGADVGTIKTQTDTVEASLATALTNLTTIINQTDTVEASLATALTNLTTIINQTDSVEGSLATLVSATDTVEASLATLLTDVASVLTAVISRRTVGGAAGIDGSGTVRVNVYLNTYTGALVDCTACTVELVDEAGTVVIASGAWTTGPTENADNSWQATKTSVSTTAGKVYRVKVSLTHSAVAYTRFIDLNAVA